jgi:hypothetical protein
VDLHTNTIYSAWKIIFNLMFVKSCGPRYVFFSRLYTKFNFTSFYVK